MIGPRVLKYCPSVKRGFLLCFDDGSSEVIPLKRPLVAKKSSSTLNIVLFDQYHRAVLNE
jgi:hypothetical protein